MKSKILRKGLAVAVFAMISGYALQASAAPSFTFTEYAGFTVNQVGVATISNVLSPYDSTLMPVAAGGPGIGHTMSWVNTASPQSSLVLTTQEASLALPANTWTTISTLTHNNIVIPVAFASWGPQDIAGRFIITDNTGGPLPPVLDSDDPIGITFVETTNTATLAGCSPPNPQNTTCDDHFSFVAGLGSLLFNANDGSQWVAQFRLWDLTNATQIGNTVYTGEAVSSSLNVQVLVSQVPEPATLSLFGLGLLGLGFARRRQLKG